MPEEKRNPERALGDAIAMVREKVRSLPDNAVNDQTYRSVRDVLGMCAFDHTNALDMLNRIDEYGAKFPDIEPREAAYYAYRDMLVEWAASMLDVSRTA